MAPITRATTSRAAKVKANSRLRRLVYDDDEVSFPRWALNQSAPEEIADGSVRPPTLSPAPSESSDRRVDILEDQVRGVRQDVASIHHKLDRLVDVATARQPTLQRASTPAPHRAPTEPNHYRDQYPPPRALVTEENRDGYVDYYSRADRFQPPVNKGKRDQMDTEPKICKPYMYIIRETCQTMKQKLEVRCELSALEYTNALIKLLMDPQGADPEDRPHIMRHLRDVTHDAMERPWSAVRKWSQSVFDSVELGDFCWAEHQEIQNERVRIAMTAPFQQVNAPQGGGAQGAAKTEFLCRDYNSKSGCRHRADHNEGQVRVLHLCAFCDAVNRQCTHSVVACDRKFMYPSARNQRIYPQQPQQTSGMRPQYDNQLTQFYGQPKNAQQAPRLF